MFKFIKNYFKRKKEEKSKADLLTYVILTTPPGCCIKCHKYMLEGILGQGLLPVCDECKIKRIKGNV